MPIRIINGNKISIRFVSSKVWRPLYSIFILGTHVHTKRGRHANCTVLASSEIFVDVFEVFPFSSKTFFRRPNGNFLRRRDAQGIFCGSPGGPVFFVIVYSEKRGLVTLTRSPFFPRAKLRAPLFRTRAEIEKAIYTPRGDRRMKCMQIRTAENSLLV
jgi:hypothetical protein